MLGRPRIKVAIALAWVVTGPGPVHSQELLGIPSGLGTPTSASTGVAGPTASRAAGEPERLPQAAAAGSMRMREALLAWEARLRNVAATEPGTPGRREAWEALRAPEAGLEDLRREGLTLAPDVATAVRGWISQYRAFWTRAARSDEDTIAILVAEKHCQVFDRDIEMLRARGMTLTPTLEAAWQERYHAYHPIPRPSRRTYPETRGRGPAPDRPAYLTSPPDFVEAGIAERVTREALRDIESLGSRDQVP